MKKQKLFISMATALLLFLCILSGCSSKRSIYENAFEAARSWEFDVAKDQFSTLPEQYHPSSSDLTAAAWIQSIDKYAESPFIGTWENGTYLIRISLAVDAYNGVHLEYKKEYTSPGGISMRDYGYVVVADDNATASFCKGYATNSKNYTLSLINDNCLEVWFNGINGIECEVTLSKA